MNSAILILLLSIVIASFSQILLKKSALKSYKSPIFEYLNFYVICGYGLMVISMFLTMLSYARLDFTLVPVLESLGYIVVMFLSLIFFHEKITRNKAIGMFFILLGIFVYHLS